jgi:hypothetical protein
VQAAVAAAAEQMILAQAESELLDKVLQVALVR